jgi:urease accessory protein
MEPAGEGKPWRAELSLGFASHTSPTHSTRTVLAHRQHHGPLVVQRPFYPEQDTCHVYLLHPPGGIAGGDQLMVNINVQAHAHSLVTTPAANKFYRSDGPLASQQQSISLDRNSRFEWLPQETIYFNGCKVHTGTKVQLNSGARFIGWEILCLGRPASNELFNEGFCRQHFELWQDEQPLFIERALLEGMSEVLRAPWGLAGMPVTGTMLITPATPTELELVRKNVQAKGTEWFSATLINNVLVLRYLGQQGEHARQRFTQAWQCVRPAVMDKPACIPRIWNT